MMVGFGRGLGEKKDGNRAIASDRISEKRKG
jgi:hypothetical protein